MDHTYYKLTVANVSNYLYDSFLRTRRNNTPNMLKLNQSDGNRKEGGGLWQKVINKNKVAAIKYKIISYQYFSTTDDRRKDSLDW